MPGYSASSPRLGMACFRTGQFESAQPRLPRGESGANTLEFVSQRSGYADTDDRRREHGRYRHRDSTTLPFEPPKPNALVNA